jgi:hypothetical protein
MVLMRRRGVMRHPTSRRSDAVRCAGRVGGKEVQVHHEGCGQKRSKSAKGHT